MKKNNIFLGFFIIVFAVLFLIGKINFSFILPVFIVFLGLSIMPQNKKITNVFLIIFIISCLSLIVLDILNETKREVESFPIEIHQEIESPIIFLSAEAGDILISGINSDKLIQGNSKSNFSKAGAIVRDNKVFLSFEGASWRKDFVNQVEILIDKEKEIELNLESFLSAIKIKEVNHKKINMSSFLSDINLEINRSVDINSDCFLSSIRLIVPSSAGIRVENNLVGSSVDFGNLIQVNEKIFQTENYEEREEKINLKIEGLFSSLIIIEK